MHVRLKSRIDKLDCLHRVARMAQCTRTPNGIQLRLEPQEVELLRFLGRELRRLLEHGDPDHGALRPFQPRQQRGADPENAATELDEAMDAELMRLRLERIEEVRERLLREVGEDEELEEVFSEAELDVWLAYLADLRLLVSAVIGITPEDPDPIDPDPREWTMEEEMYIFLSALQEGVLDSLQGED